MVQLTQFEQQVFQVFVELCQDQPTSSGYGPEGAYSVWDISDMLQYGEIDPGFYDVDDEGDPIPMTKNGFEQTPTVNAAIGRLQRKGILTSSLNTASVRRYHFWTLTALGRDLAGLPPV